MKLLPNAIPHSLVLAMLLVTTVMLTGGCSQLKKRHQVDLGVADSDLAQPPDHLRNPVIVVPGNLGSKLMNKTSTPDQCGVGRTA